jgi:hypothetical protein
MPANDDARLAANRDAAIERLLREMPAAGAAAGPCLEPEALAAWMDGALSPDERAAAERHAAACERCQSMIAAMALTEPVPARHAPWWAARTARWMAPIVAAAAAVALWFAVNPSVLRAPSTLAPPQAASQAAPPPPEAPDTASRETATRPPAVQSPAASTQTKTSARRDERRSETTSAAPPALADKLEKKVAQVPERSTFSNEMKADAAPAPVPPLALAPASAAPAPPAEATIAGEKATASTGIASPAAATRWRIVAPDRVDFSRDGGATWERTELPAGAEVTGGASPAAEVCWLVGGNGLVLRTLDGVTWTRVGLPETVTLVRVSATSADAAAVTSDSGVTFATADGGRTWTRR